MYCSLGVAIWIVKTLVVFFLLTYVNKPYVMVHMCEKCILGITGIFYAKDSIFISKRLLTSLFFY